MIWLAIWYVFCAINIALVLYIFRVLNRPSIRSEIGDITTQVGYEEDETGKVLKTDWWSDPNAAPEESHVMPTGSQTNGLL